MFEYTHRNHFRVQFGEHKPVQFGKAARSISSFRDECAQAADLIAKSGPGGAVHVCLSGGIDGEIACRAFLDAGHKVKPLILKWKYGLNLVEVDLARAFCRDFDLQLEEIEADVVQFFSGGFWKYCEKLGLPMWAAVWKAWIADHHDGFLVMGNGWPQTYLDESMGRVRLREDSHSVNPFQLDERPAVPDFFRYHPELMLSILNEPDIRRWCTRCHMPLEKLKEVLTFKYFALSKYYENERFPLAFRPKRTGVENILPLAKEAIELSKEKYGKNVKSVTWDYDEFVRELGGHFVE